MMKKAGVPEDHEMFYSVSRIESQAERAAGIIRRIRSFTRRSEPKMEAIAIEHLVDEVKELGVVQFIEEGELVYVDWHILKDTIDYLRTFDPLGGDMDSIIEDVLGSI